MIYIVKGQSHNIALTLDEKASTSTYDVIFRFVNELDGTEKVFTAVDQSTVTRYNHFNIIETNSQNVYYGRIQLDAGQYKYTIYEMPTASPRSLNYNNAVGVLEQGRVTVFEADTNNEFDANDSKNSNSFE